MVRYFQYNGSNIQLIAALCLKNLTNKVSYNMAESLIHCNIFGILLDILRGTDDSELQNHVASIICNIISFIMDTDNPNHSLIDKILEHSDPDFLDMIEEHEIPVQGNEKTPYLKTMSVLKEIIQMRMLELEEDE